MTERASHASSPRALRSAAARAAGYLMLWLILSGADPASLPAGAVAAIAATWTSLRLLPVRSWRISPAPMTSLIFRFLHQSLIAGVDVARRALDPRLPLQIGFVTYPTHLTPGTARNTFCTLSSLLPGTLPVRLLRKRQPPRSLPGCFGANRGAAEPGRGAARAGHCRGIRSWMTSYWQLPDLCWRWLPWAWSAFFAVRRRQTG